MLHITVIFLDGTQGWEVTRVKTKKTTGTFDVNTCHEVFCSVEGLSGELGSMSLEELCGEPNQVENVISCMNEESGVVFVGVEL